MTNSNKQKQEKDEQAFYDQLRESLYDFPSGDSRSRRGIESRGEPDFLVGIAFDNYLGVELTEVVSTERIKRGVGCAEIVRLAQKIAVEAHLPPVCADIYFTQESSFSKLDFEPIAKRIADAVAGFRDIPGEICNTQSQGDSLPPQVSVISLRKSDRHRWEFEPAGIVTENFAASLQILIDKKNERLEKQYAKTCKECWLLVYANWDQGPHGFFELSPAMRAHTFTSDFSRTHFIAGYQRSVDLLKTKKRDSR